MTPEIRPGRAYDPYLANGVTYRENPPFLWTKTGSLDFQTNFSEM